MIVNHHRLEYTPGPWQSEKGEFVFQHHVFHIDTSGHRMPIGIVYGGRDEPNLPLILATPYLLEALKALHSAGVEPLLYQPETKQTKSRERAVQAYMDACELAVAAMTNVAGPQG